MSKKHKHHAPRNESKNVEGFNFSGVNNSEPELVRESSGQPKKMKNRLYNVALLIGVGLIVGSLVVKKNNTQWEQIETDQESMQEDQEEMTDNNLEGVMDKVEMVKKGDSSSASVGSNYLEGLLTLSDDQDKGSLKLVSDLGGVYIRTNRDYSKLVGLQVLVLINGGLENFELLDIQPAVQKDGYILSN